MRRPRRSDMSPAGAAARGAAAGFLGGIALTALDRFVAPRMGGPRRERDWDNGVADVLARVGLQLSDRGRATAGIASGLLYATCLGAAYGVARQRWHKSPATIGLLDAALVYGASLVSREPPRPRRGIKRRSARAARAVSSIAVFGTATAAAYKALSRRAG